MLFRAGTLAASRRGNFEQSTTHSLYRNLLLMYRAGRFKLLILNLFLKKPKIDVGVVTMSFLKTFFSEGIIPDTSPTNIRKLLTSCPDEFKKYGNPWLRVGWQLVAHVELDQDISNCADTLIFTFPEQKEQRLDFLEKLVLAHVSGIPLSDIAATVGWILRESLAELPSIYQTSKKRVSG